MVSYTVVRALQWNFSGTQVILIKRLGKNKDGQGLTPFFEVMPVSVKGLVINLMIHSAGELLGSLLGRVQHNATQHDMANLFYYSLLKKMTKTFTDLHSHRLGFF